MEDLKFAINYWHFVFAFKKLDTPQKVVPAPIEVIITNTKFVI